jgi:hypothetical protein
MTEGDLQLLVEFRREVPAPDEETARRIYSLATSGQPRRRLPWHIRAGSRRARRLVVVGFATAIALLSATLAIGAVGGWGFLQIGNGSIGPPPKLVPAGEVLVVASGSWDNQDWTLVAYRNPDGDECSSFLMGVSAANAKNGIGAISCVNVSEGVSPVFEAKSADFPAHLEGPVSADASTVEVALSDGSTIDAKTIAPPDGLGLLVRYVVLPIPCGAVPHSVSEINDQGSVVARYRIHTSLNPLADDESLNACD